MDSPTLAIRRVPLDSLHTDPANARSHGPENMDAIVASLKRFGQAEPLVVHKQTGRVIGGNGRLVAMKQLGWNDCDVVELYIDELTATSLGIALNRTADLASWDEETLAKLLQELKAEDALDGVGYSDDDLDKLLADLDINAGNDDVDDPGPGQPPDKPISVTGDLWILGDHRLLCGDSTKAGDVTRLMAGETAALLATDPPYCVDYTGADRPEASGKDWSDKYKEIEIADLGEFLRAVLKAILPELRDNAALYIWHAHLQYPVIDRVLDEFGILRHQPIIWKKPSSTFTYSFYRWSHEPCIFGWKKGNKPPHYLKNAINTVWEVDWEGKSRISTFHPTSKPPRLFEIPMEQHTRAGDVVFEPFCGSGSQIIAAEKLGRRCLAMELEPAFVDGTVERWEKATGKTAVLDGAGTTFDDVRTDRLQAQEL
jgi:DNA modification methylase